MVALDTEIVDRIQGYRQVTDALLLSLAMQHHGCLVTLDFRLAQLHPGAGHPTVVVIPVPH